jgi:hypothetical protein
MLSVQYFDARAIKVPFECCYCNTAIGSEKFTVKKFAKKDRMVQKNLLQFPICRDCKKKYRNRMILAYTFGVVVFSILIFILAVISIEVDIAWLTLVLVLIMERVFQFVFGKYVIEPLRPAILKADGAISFHNKDYQRRFYEVNYPANLIGDDDDANNRWQE